MPKCDFNKVDVSQQKIKCRPIRTREIGGVSLSDVLYVKIIITR